ncbi:MAG: DinB family protein [Pseudomonadota bacterium]
MSLIDYFKQLAAYHVWACDRLVEGMAEDLAEDDYRRDVGLFFQSVHGTLNHLLVAEHLWQIRLIDHKPARIALHAELHADRQLLAGELQAMARRWPVWLDGLSDKVFNEPLTYTRNNGEALTLPMAATLGHIFNHATHHRGQITAALTTMGLKPAELDWVFLLQQQARGASSAPT